MDERAVVSDPEVGKFCFDFKKHAPGMVCKATFAHCDFLMMGSTDVFFGSMDFVERRVAILFFVLCQ